MTPGDPIDPPGPATAGTPRPAPTVEPLPPADAGAAVGAEIAPVRLGERLRHARRVKGLRLKDLATRAGCSEGFLSKVENGRALPSLPLLHRLVGALETNIAWLFGPGPEGGDAIVTRAADRPRIRLDPVRRGVGIVLERVIAHREGHLLQCNIHHLAPGGESAGAITHRGEEVGYVLTGTVELSVDGRSWVLDAGDSFHFASDRPHGYRNAGGGPAAILWVNTPPTF